MWKSTKNEKKIEKFPKMWISLKKVQNVEKDKNRKYKKCPNII